MKELRMLMDLMEEESSLDKIFFSERSVLADREIFAKLLHQEKKMNKIEYHLYLNMYSSLDSLFKTPRAHKFIYLRSSPTNCLRKIEKRARFE